MKTFTIEQANRTLPLVSRIVQDIVVHWRRWRERVQMFELATAGARPEQPDADLAALEREIQALAEEIERFERELAELGVQLKDRDLGLVDFPGMRDGRLVYLCWRLGEPAVAHWHELDAGYAGRQRLVPQLLP